MSFFFSGSYSLKLDDKGRFVLPNAFRLGLVEEGKLDFVMCLGLGKSLHIYKRSDIEKIVKKFQEKQHVAKFQPFFTTFFSTLHQTSCDRLGRTNIPTFLQQVVGIEKEIIVCGVLNKIEIWPKKTYENNLQKLFTEEEGLEKTMEDVFALLEDKEELPRSNTSELPPMTKLTEQQLGKVGALFSE